MLMNVRFKSRIRLHYSSGNCLQTHTSSE